MITVQIPRRRGMTWAIVLDMVEKLRNKQTIGVLSKEYPSQIDKMLTNEGVDFKVEEIKPIPRYEPIYSRNGYEEFISGYTEKISEYSTFIFSSTSKDKTKKHEN